MLIFKQLNIFHRVARDKSVLADHDRQMDSGVLCDRERLDIIVIGFLVVFRVDLDPSRISRSHAVGMVAVDIDRARQSSVDKRQNDGKTVGCRKEQLLPHERKSRGRGRCHSSRAGCFRADRRRHGRVFALYRNKFCIDLSVCDKRRYHLRDLRRRRDRKRRHDVGIDLPDRVRDCFIT